jgi:hypothetical protein
MYEYSTQADKAIRTGRQSDVLYGVFSCPKYVYENLGRTDEGARIRSPIRVRYGMVYGKNEGAL